MANSWVVAESVSVDFLRLTAWEQGSNGVCLLEANYNLAGTPTVGIVGNI
jgi:hypothetical protein